MEQTILKFVWNDRRSWVAKAILNKNNKTEDIIVLILNYTIKL